MPTQNTQTTTYAYRQCSEHIQREHQEELYQYKKRFEGESAVEETVSYTKYNSVGAAIDRPLQRSQIHIVCMKTLTFPTKILHLLS